MPSKKPSGRPIKVQILAKDGKSSRTRAFSTPEGAQKAAREHRNQGHWVEIHGLPKKRSRKK